MAEQNVKIVVSAEDKASGPIRDVNNAIGTLEKGANKVSSALGSIGRVAEIAGGVLVSTFATQGIAAISSLQREMVKLSLEQSRFQVQTQALLGNIGLAAYSQEIEKVVEQHGKMTSFDDISIRKSLNNIASATKDYQKSLLLLKAAEDLAAAKGIELETATNQITQALEGSTAALSRAGVELDTVAMKSMTASQAIYYISQQIEKTFGGSATALRNSTAGIFANYENQVQNLKRLFGDELTAAIAPALDSIANKISSLIESGQLQPLIDSFGHLATNIVDAAGKVWELGKALLGAKTDAEAIETIAATFNTLAAAIKWAADQLERLTRLINSVNAGALSFGDQYLKSDTGGPGVRDLLRMTNERAVQPKLVQTVPIQNLPKVETAADALSRLREGTRVETENRDRKVDNTIATMNNTVATMTSTEYFNLMRNKTGETTLEIEKLGQTAGGAINFMNSAISSVQQMLAAAGGGGGGSKKSCHGKCPTFGSSERVEAGVDIVYEGPDRGGRGAYIPVPDALITKRGDVVKFHPEDNILAFKDPAALRGGKSSNINVTINVSGSRDPDAIADEIMRRINRITRVGF